MILNYCTAAYGERVNMSDLVIQMADLKVAIKGAAKVDQDIKERRDGSLLVKYISHMSGDVLITLVSLIPLTACHVLKD